MLRTLSLLLASVILLQPTPPKWRLVEEWRVGGDAAGPHSLLDVRGLELLPNGGLAVLEFKDQQIHFLDPRGRAVRTVGRNGSGPGEYQNANGLVVLPNGNLVINDPDNNRFTLLGPTGDFLKTIPMDLARGFGWMWDAWVDQRGMVGENFSRRRGERWIIARQLWSPDFAKSDTLPVADCPPGPIVPSGEVSYSFRSDRGGMSMRIPHAAPRKPSIHAPDGGTWIAHWPGFEAITHIPAGACTPDVTIPLTGPRVAIPNVVRDSVVKQVMQAASQYSPPGPDLDKIPRVFPTFDMMRLDRTGLLWVSRWSDASHKRFDVYGQHGALLATVDAPPTLEPLRPMIITTDRVYGFVADTDDVPYLAAYRIVK